MDYVRERVMLINAITPISVHNARKLHQRNHCRQSSHLMLQRP